MRTNRTKRIAAVAVIATIGLVGAGLTAAQASTTEQPRAAKRGVATPFALKGWGYGTSVDGGSIPTGSGPTAYEVIGCTNRAGLTATNNVADAALPSLGTVEGVKTRVWTTKSGKVVSAWASNTIGKVTLSDSPLGSLVLSAIESTARAYHDGRAFRTATNTDLAKLVFKPAAGPAMTFPLPKPGRPVEIPGFATVTIAHSYTPKNANGARAYSNGLKVDLHASHSVVRVGHAVAHIARGVKVGVFTGQSYGIGGKAAGDIVRLGRNPLLKMPCQGTFGRVATRTLSGTDLGGQVVVGVARDRQMAKQTSTRAWGYERSQIASINLGGGVVVNGIVGQVNVSRQGPNLRRLVANTHGTAIGNLVVNGRSQELPLSRTVTIPGVAKLQPRIVTKLPNGLQVIALRITLLDGSGAVIDLGTANFQVRRVPRPPR